MNFSLTVSARSKPIRGGQITPVNVTLDGVAATITTRYKILNHANIITLAHYPKTVVLIEYDW